MIVALIFEMALGMVLLFGGLRLFRERLSEALDALAVVIMSVGIFLFAGATANFAIHYPWIFIRPH